MGKYSTYYINDEGKTRMLPLYNTWFDMYQRSTSMRSKLLRPHYMDTELYPKWCSYDNFVDWAIPQIGCGSIGMDGHLYQLDKDLLSNGVNAYSPDTCCFLPKEINTFIQKNIHVNNTTGFTGVSVLPNGKYRACVRDPRAGKNLHLGCFTSPEEAYSAYLKAKSDIAKYLASKYVGLISEDAYHTLITM